MRTRDFAFKFIRFDKTSPVTGPFRLPMYPFLGKPLDAADDIRIKRLVILKASSCLGTVLGQIINAKRIACDVGDQIMVCQTDDDASKWTKTRGKEWLESIADVERLVKNDKYAKTNDLWLFRHKFLKISGPGITAAQSDQVRFVQTDESHLETYPPGRLVEWEKRMGARWDRQSTHITTAADEGKEIDQFYYEGDQNEWNHRCPKCAKLFWPLWQEASKEHYNGEEVFIWREYQSETATLDSIQEKCPHCDHIGQDTSRDRFAWQRDADYVAMNPTAPIETSSYRWAAFAAAHWMPLREFLAEHLAAIRAAKMFDFKPHEDFVKKRECRSYSKQPPDMGDGTGIDDYKLGSVWITEHPKHRVCSFDVQDAGGFHLWAQSDEFNQVGDSRRLAYDRLASWADARAFQQHHGVEDRDTFCDAGHRMREVFGQCATFKWYALFADDSMEFAHKLTDPRTHEVTIIRKPYSPTQIEDPMSGKSGAPTIIRAGQIPKGMCGSRHWSKFVFGSYLMALKAGNGQYYGIASDINPEYVAQLNSYTFAITINKISGVRTTILRQVKVDDHSFATSSMCLVGATIAGYFPLSKTIQPEQKTELATV